MKPHPFLTVHSHMQEAHDHLHELCMGTKEAGREISKAHLDKLGLAHDHMAAAIGVPCRYHTPSGQDLRNAPLQKATPTHTHSDDYPSGADYRNAPASKDVPRARSLERIIEREKAWVSFPCASIAMKRTQLSSCWKAWDTRFAGEVTYPKRARSGTKVG